MMWMCCASNLDILQLTRTVSTEQNSKQLTFSYHNSHSASLLHGSIPPKHLLDPHPYLAKAHRWKVLSQRIFADLSQISQQDLAVPYRMQLHPALLCAVSGWWGSWTEILHDPSPVFGGLLVKSLSFPFHSILIKITWKQWSLVIQSFSLDFAIQSLAYFQIMFTDISTPGLDSAVK